MSDKNNEKVEEKTIASEVRTMMLDREAANGVTNGHLEKDEKKLAIEKAVRTILENIGEDPDREGLERTPHRVAKSYDELLAGYEMDPVAVVTAKFTRDP